MTRSVSRTFVILFILSITLTGCDKFSLLGEFSQSTTTTATGPLTILPTAPAVLVGRTVNFAASGGSTPYSFSVQAGGAGGAVDPLTGVYTAPITVGSGTDTVILTDGIGTAVQSVVTIVAASQLQISPSAVTIQVNNSYQFGATGGSGGYTYSIYSGGGSVDGTGKYTAPSSPTTAYVRVTDSVGSISDATAAVVAGGALAITPTSVQIAENSSFTFAASGGTPGYTFSIVSGGTGTINPATGVYSAIGAVGPAAATIQVTDSTLATAAIPATVNIIPAAPSGLAVTATVGNMHLSWQNHTSSSDNVIVQRKTGSAGAWGLLATLSSTATSYDDGVSPNNTLYDYRVYAVKGTLNSNYSNEAFAVASP